VERISLITHSTGFWYRQLKSLERLNGKLRAFCPPTETSNDQFITSSGQTRSMNCDRKSVDHRFKLSSVKPLVTTFRFIIRGLINLCSTLSSLYVSFNHLSADLAVSTAQCSLELTSPTSASFSSLSSTARRLDKKAHAPTFCFFSFSHQKMISLR
jgi:hypothetical protein